MRTASIPLVATLPMTAGAHADTLALDLQGVSERMRFADECSDGVRRAVDDVNLPYDDLARVGAGPDRRLFLAASGAKHAAGARARWSKGSAASLLDMTRGDAPVAECRQSKGGSRG